MKTEWIEKVFLLADNHIRPLPVDFVEARAELEAIREENARLREALEEVIWEHEEHGPNVLTCREMELMKDALSGELSRMSQAEMLDRQHAVGYRDAHADIQEQGKVLVDQKAYIVLGKAASRACTMMAECLEHGTCDGAWGEMEAVKAKLIAALLKEAE